MRDDMGDEEGGKLKDHLRHSHAHEEWRHAHAIVDEVHLEKAFHTLHTGGGGEVKYEDLREKSLLGASFFGI